MNMRREGAANASRAAAGQPAGRDATSDDRKRRTRSGGLPRYGAQSGNASAGRPSPSIDQLADTPSPSINHLQLAGMPMLPPLRLSPIPAQAASAPPQQAAAPASQGPAGQDLANKVAVQLAPNKMTDADLAARTDRTGCCSSTTESRVRLSRSPGHVDAVQAGELVRDQIVERHPALLAAVAWVRPRMDRAN